MDFSGERGHLALVRPLPPVAATKLLPRSLPRAHVPRPRLLTALGMIDGRPLAVVTGPAGSGKTVLVRAWLETLPAGAVAWAGVDSADATDVAFWTTVCSAIAQVAPPVAGAALDLLAAGASAPVAKRRLLQALEDWCLDRELVLVVDDFHLIEAPDVDSQLSWFVDHLPTRCRVVVLSRTEPRLALGRRRINEELIEVRAADLAFRPDEAARLFERFADIAVDADAVSALTERTEGWVAGLQLAALALRRSADPDRFVERFNGSTEGVADFLLEEVLDRQEPDVRAFLLATSVLTSFSAELSAAVTDDPGAARILANLDAEELFVLPIEGADGWYRYHQLFADLLQRELRLDRPGLDVELHRRAATWLADHDQPAAALDHAVAAGAEDVAFDLVLAHHLWLANNGGAAAVRRALTAVRPETILADPERAIELLWAMGFAGMPGAAMQMLDQLESALGDDTPAPLRGRVATIRALAEAASGQLEAALATRERAKRLLGRPVPGDDAAARVPLFLGRCFTSAELFAEAQSHLAEARSLAPGRELPTWVVDGAIAELRVHEGRLSEATALAEAALAQWHADGSPPNPGASDMLRARAALHTEAGDDDAAWALLELAAATLGGQAGIGSAVNVRTLTARIEWLRATGRPASALDEIDQLDGSWERFPPGPLLDSGLAEVEAHAALACGDIARAVRAERRLVGSARPIVRARIALATDDRAAALAHLDQLGADAPVRRRIEAHLLTARSRAGEPAAHRAATEAAVDVALEAGFAGSLLVEPSVLPTLEEIARDRPSPRLRAILRLATTSSGPAELPGTPERLTDRELDLLRLLPTHLSNKELSATLYVSLNTVKSHLKSVYRKLDATSRSEAVERARAAGLLPR